MPASALEVDHDRGASRSEDVIVMQTAEDHVAFVQGRPARRPVSSTPVAPSVYRQCPCVEQSACGQRIALSREPLERVAVDELLDAGTRARPA